MTVLIFPIEYIYSEKYPVSCGFIQGVKCWNSNSMGARGYAKEGWELTPMSSFDVEQGGINSGPDSRGVPEGVQTDGPGFSLCAAPLESSGSGFCGVDLL